MVRVRIVTVLTHADPGPFNGTVELNNNLGLPPLPQAPQAANGTSTRIGRLGEL